MPPRIDTFSVAVLTIGNEVLGGRTADTNFLKLTRALSDCGAEVVWHASCRDVVDEIVETLRGALRRARLVILTGGLGPTSDDLTRKAVSVALERTLVLNDAALAAIQARFKARDVAMPPSNEVQALLPNGAQVIPNANGTAPGFLVLHGTQHVAALPGVPWEMEGMLESFLLPWVRERASGALTTHLVLRTCGVTESALAEQLKAFERRVPEGASFAYLPHGTGVDLRISLRGSPAETEARGVELRAELMKAAGDFVYGEGDQTLEGVVGELLKLGGLTLATAESCTGGLLGGRVTRVSGSSAWYDRGVVTYSNQAKTDLAGVPAELIERHGAVSREVAAAMAAGIRERSGAAVGVSITGVAGPTGGTEEKPVGLVYVGLEWSAEASPTRGAAKPRTPRGTGGVAVRKLRLAGDRELVRARAVTAALDMVRRLLLGLPVDPT
jgi:nicotinamide-nucleotide amidase